MAKILVAGASGFVGRLLTQALLAQGHQVVATSRRARAPQPAGGGPHWVVCDMLAPASLAGVFDGVEAAYYLVHSMADHRADYGELEAKAAHAFADAAAKAGVSRVVYLGGPAPGGVPSEHLRSRLAVGEILRGGPVPALELRASMIIGHGSASWQIVRDLAMRLPFMILPRWLKSRTRPVAVDDVIAALIGALTLPLPGAATYDIAGDEVLSGRDILERIAKVGGRSFWAVEIPWLTPELSAMWLRLITRTNLSVARELVVGFRQDLLPINNTYWQAIGHDQLVSFDEAARRAFAVARIESGAR